MNTNKKRNRIILCICSILVLFASVFAFIPLNKETKVVKADTVTYDAYFRGAPVTFSSSMYEFFYDSNNELRSVYYDGGLNSYQVASHGNYSNYFPFLYTVLSIHMRYNANGVVEFLPILQHPEIVNNNFASTNGIMNLYNYTFLNKTGDTLEDCERYFNGYVDDMGRASGQWFAIDGSSGLVPGKHLLATNNASDFNGGWFYELNQHVSGILFHYNISSLNFKIEKIFSIDFFGDSVRYYDTDGNWIEFSVLSSNYAHAPRTYYFANNLFTDNDYYQNGYNSGYDNGYNEGVINGQTSGYKSGYQSGKNDGYNLGRNEAIESSGRYSFTSLISSVIDVPVKAFTSLFNFEILGVNLSGFFLGLLTCCIVIGVVRLIL